MTREEAIKVLNMVEAHGLAEEAKQMAIKALSQEPCDECVYSTKDGYCQYDDVTETIPPLEQCDDAISRDAVLNTEYQVKIINDIEYVMLSEVQMKIRKMPPVTQKSGKWLEKDLRKEEYVLVGKCSVCGQVRVTDKLCSNCGAKMESEEQTE